MRINGYHSDDSSPLVAPKRTVVKVSDIETLRRHWRWLEDKLLKLKQKDKVGVENWEPGHIREQIISGFRGQNAIELRLLLDPDLSLVGFLITSTYVDMYTQLPEALVVWIFWGDNAMMDQFMPALDELAKSRFLKEIMFISGRRGWMKRAAHAGFHVKRIVYSRSVKP
jgi:hypothetical protein